MPGFLTFVSGIAKPAVFRSLHEPGTPECMRRNHILAGVAAAGALLLTPACSDEDGDGATTDEEMQDVEDGANEVQDQVEEETEGQDEGSNEDGE
jgi:hypothetical protein